MNKLISPINHLNSNYSIIIYFFVMHVCFMLDNTLTYFYLIQIRQNQQPAAAVPQQQEGVSQLTTARLLEALCAHDSISECSEILRAHTVLPQPLPKG